MLFNCIAASPGWGWEREGGFSCIRLAQLLLNIALMDAWCLRRIFFGFWSMECWTVRTANGHFLSCLSNEVCPLWRAIYLGWLSSLNVNDTVLLTLKADTSLSHWWPRGFVEGSSICYKFKLQPVFCLCGKLDGKTPLTWCMHPVHGWEFLGLEAGALSVQRSAGECALLSFLREIGTDFFSIQIEIIGKFKQHK